MRNYLQCGDLHRGFARLACCGCRYQAILAYSCKCRLFCPSCQQKRILLFAEWLDTHILEQVSHAQYVFTIPKLLRPIFKYHPRDLGLLCKSAWQALLQMFQQVSSDSSAVPGVVLSFQNYGDRLNLHPHVHAIASRGVWSSDGTFEPIPALAGRPLMLLFRYLVLRNLLAAGRITQTTIDILDRFHHPGFSAYEGHGVAPSDSAARERLASYLIHPAFSLARLHYDRLARIVTYDPHPCSRSIPSPAHPEQFSPLNALAALTAFIPEKGQQVVRYCGYYSNKTRGQRRLKQQCPTAIIPATVSAPEPEPDNFRRYAKRAWARLIRKIWAADPLACPKCGARLRIISFIDDPPVIEKILRHLKLWNPPARPPPPRATVSLEMDPDFLAWQAAGRLFDGID